ncbi:hypothetical protein N7474_006284 [Penicillium riverlandense]|uniref:uncharacterized protein n=1 Tax=Penicillium riverlandense TaxID=1903569 RepID=UPI00254794CE|nr:uncharacterized protein N7474_006284 [Penicillium riverlandense]KAJ5814507.1 hypothetical protein N7474_006284 [Penicillium riverlandense]
MWPCPVAITCRFGPSEGWNRLLPKYTSSRRNGVQDGDGSEDCLGALIQEARVNAGVLIRPSPVGVEIGVRIYRVMLEPVEELDASKLLMALGGDFLVVVEIRDRNRPTSLVPAFHSRQSEI